jgi:hypothetical protein
MADRMAARSTTAGTPVKSCSRTRAGRNGISSRAGAFRVIGRQPLDVLLAYRKTIEVSKQPFEQDLDRDREPGNVVALI